jgi:hypothetical protein
LRGVFEANCEFIRFDPASQVELLAVARLDEIVDITGVGSTLSPVRFRYPAQIGVLGI